MYECGWWCLWQFLQYLADMTARSVNAMRQAFRKNIRKEQLYERFQHERILNMGVDPADAVRSIEGYLKNLQVALWQWNMKEAARVMTHMRSIAGQFMIIDFLMRKVSISILPRTPKNSKFCDSVSWIEVFLQLLNEEDEAVRQESSALLSLSLFQIRIANCEKYKLRKLIIIQKFPIKFLSDANWKVTMHMLAGFEELIEMTEFQKEVIYLINNQHFLMVFVSLLEDEDRMQITPYQERVVEASLLLIHFMSRCERLNTRPEIQRMHELVKQMVMLRLKKGETSQQLFAMVRVLSLSQVQFSCQEINGIESLLNAELYRQNFWYFQMLNAIICQQDYIVSAYSFEALTFELFRCNYQKDPNSECLKKWLALIFHKSLQLIQSFAERRDYLQVLGNLTKNQLFMENSSIILGEAGQSNEPLFITLIQSLRTICSLLEFSDETMPIMAMIQRYEDFSLLEIP